MSTRLGIGLGPQGPTADNSPDEEAAVIADILKEYTVKLRDRCNEYTLHEEKNKRNKLLMLVISTFIFSISAIIVSSLSNWPSPAPNNALSPAVTKATLVSTIASLGIAFYYIYSLRTQWQIKAQLLQLEIKMLSRRLIKAIRFSSQYNDQFDSSQRLTAAALQRDLLRIDAETVLRYVVATTDLRLSELELSDGDRDKVPIPLP